MNRMILTAICVLFFSYLSARAAQDSGVPDTARPDQFHLPQTEAEKALNDILRLYDTDNNLAEFVLHTPDYEPRKDPGYSRLFTYALLKVLRHQEAECRQEKNNSDKQGDSDNEILCKFERGPITCVNDFPDHYIFRTEKQAGDSAIITSAWSDPFDKNGTYHLIYADHRWQLDGIHCPNMNGFNMK